MNAEELRALGIGGGTFENPASFRSLSRNASATVSLAFFSSTGPNSVCSSR